MCVWCMCEHFGGYKTINRIPIDKELMLINIKHFIYIYIYIYEWVNEWVHSKAPLQIIIRNMTPMSLVAFQHKLESN